MHFWRQTVFEKGGITFWHMVKSYIGQKKVENQWYTAKACYCNTLEKCDAWREEKENGERWYVLLVQYSGSIVTSVSRHTAMQFTKIQLQEHHAALRYTTSDGSTSPHTVWVKRRHTLRHHILPHYTWQANHHFLTNQFLFLNNTSNGKCLSTTYNVSLLCTTILAFIFIRISTTTTPYYLALPPLHHVEK